MGLPVIISPDISDDSAIIERENIGVIMDFTDDRQFLNTIKKIEVLLKNKNELQKKISK
jgi:hypothetical protein